MGTVQFGFKTKKPNQTVYLEHKLNQTVYELPVFKPNHLRKSWNQTVYGKIWNQTEPFNKKFKPNHLSQTN